MIFTKEQVERLMEIIDLHTSMFIVTQMGDDVLSTYDKYILGKFGFDIKKIIQTYPPYLQSFLFGRLTSWLSDNQTSKIAYKDFTKYLKTGQYFPLTDHEQNMYEIATQRSYSHIKNLGVKRKDEMTRQINEQEVRKELQSAIKNRESISTIISNWGHKHENWNRDYGRIAETEMNSIFNLGRATQYRERFGEDVLVYKETFPQACRHCIRLHLTGGIGSEPIVKKLSEIIANGTNIGKKVAEWLFTIDSEHPFCRCILKYVLPGMEWNDEKKMFEYPEKKEYKKRYNFKISVGDQDFDTWKITS